MDKQVLIVILITSVNYFMLQLNCEDRQVQYKAVFHPILTIQTLGPVYQHVSRLQCAAKCLGALLQCQCFQYNKTNLECRLVTLGFHCVYTSSGSGLITTLTPVQPPLTYTWKNPIKTACGFQLITVNMTTVCVFISTGRANYTDAVADCTSKNAHLYLPKNAGKMEVLKNIPGIIGQNIWIGLDDIVTEGVYVWEDDGKVLDATWKTQLYCNGEPNNNHGNEDYNMVRVNDNCAFDSPISDQNYYLCEITDFL